MTTLELVPPTQPDQETLQTQASDLVIRARELVIETPEQYIAAADFLKFDIKALERRIVDFFSPLKKKAHEAWKALCDSENDQLRPVKEAEQIAKRAILTYQAKEEEKRREEQIKREAEAKRLAEEAALLEALHLEEMGETAAAEAVISEPIVAPVINMPRAMPKVAGIVPKTTYSAKVANLHELVKFVAANPQWLPFLEANMTALNAQARSLKDAMRIPGVEVVKTNGLSSGSR